MILYFHSQFHHMASGQIIMNSSGEQNCNFSVEGVSIEWLIISTVFMQ